MSKWSRPIHPLGAAYLYTVWLVVSFLLAGLQGDLLQWRWPALAFLLGWLAHLSVVVWFPVESCADCASGPSWGEQDWDAQRPG